MLAEKVDSSQAMRATESRGNEGGGVTFELSSLASLSSLRSRSSLGLLVGDGGVLHDEVL